MDKFKNVEPGTMVYCIDEDGVSPFVYMGTCLDFVFLCMDYEDYEGHFLNLLCEMCNNSLEGRSNDIFIVPASIVFLNEEEAEFNVPLFDQLIQSV